MQSCVFRPSLVTGVCCLTCWLPVGAAEDAGPSQPPFEDEPAAHALYDQMIEAMRKADSLSYVSQYEWEFEKDRGNCTYQVWLKKPNYFRLETQSSSGEEGGIIIGDGDTLWIHWPQGRPKDPLEESEAYEKTRLTSYIKDFAPLGGHSIGHETGFLGVGLVQPILDPSTFHDGLVGLQPYLDGVKYLGTEEVGTEECDKIEISYFDHQQSWHLWLSKRDHLPRKLKHIVRLSSDYVIYEQWSSVILNADIPETMFAWKPPDGWTEYRRPAPQERLLKPGTKAPDFELASADGKRIRLSDYRGQVVWLYFWKAG